MSRLCRASGQTVLFVTHDIEEAVYLADRVVVLAGSPGRIVAAHRIAAAQPRDRSAPELKAMTLVIREELMGAGG